MKANRFLQLFLLLVFISQTLWAQEYRIAVIPKGEKRWGYINMKGEMIVTPQSHLPIPYTEDGTIITTDEKLYDKDGNEIITDVKIRLTLEGWTGELNGVQGGMYIQKKAGKLGALNTKGKLTVQFLYTELTDFSDGYAQGRREKVYYIVDSAGNETKIERNDEITHIKQFHEGLAPIELNGNQTGFVNTEGKIVIEPVYKTVGYFSDGLAWVRVKSKLIGFIDKSGEWVIEPKFEVAKGYDKESGLALVQMKSSQEHWSYTNRDGELINFDMVDETYGFTNGLGRARFGKLYGFINNKGEWVIDPVWEGAGFFYNGYVGVRKGKYWGIINKAGEWVLQPEYKRVAEVILLK